MKGKYSVRGACSWESLVRGHRFVAPFPTRADSPQTQAGIDLDTESWGDPGYTHTQSSTPITAVANANQESVRERERDYLHLVGQRRQAAFRHYCERLLAFQRGGM